MENAKTGMLTPKQLKQERHVGNVAQVYKAIYERHRNGLAPAVRRIGGRWLVSVEGWHKWLDEINGIGEEVA